MKEIKALSKKINDQLATIERLDGEIARLEQTIHAADADNCGLESLRQRRKVVLVDAHVKGVKPDTSAIDTAIAAAEKRRAELLESGEAAREALDTITAAREKADFELATLQSNRIEVVTSYFLAQHDQAQKRYFEAVASLKEPIAEMVAAERAWRVATEAGAGERFGARGAQALADVRSTGIRVTWDQSALQDSKVAAEYTDNYRDFWYVPDWADARNEDFGDAEANRMLAEIRAAGVAVDAIPRKESVAVEKQVEKRVEIEVVRGSVNGQKPGATKRDPATGKLTGAVKVVYTVGDRFMASESDARHLIKTGVARLAADMDAERDRIAHEQWAVSGVATVRDADGAPAYRSMVRGGRAGVAAS